MTQMYKINKDSMFWKIYFQMLKNQLFFNAFKLNLSPSRSQISWLNWITNWFGIVARLTQCSTATRSRKLCLCERCILELLGLRPLLQTLDVLPSGSSITFETVQSRLLSVTYCFNADSMSVWVRPTVSLINHGPRECFSVYEKHTFFAFVPGSLVIGKGETGGGVVVLVLCHGRYQNSKFW